MTKHGKDCGCPDCVNDRIDLETRRTGTCARCKGAGSFQVGFPNEAEIRTVLCPCQGTTNRSRFTDLDEAARQLLMTLAEGGDGTAMSVMMGHALIKAKLTKLAEQIWNQGWDCREEQGPLAGAFGHANRYNPYRKKTEPEKCRHCGAQPLYTERGRCEDCGDCQGCGEDDCVACHNEIIRDTVRGTGGQP